MKRWQPVDWVVLALAVAIAIALLVTSIVPIILGLPISDARSKSISTITTAIISVVSVYVGAKIRFRSDDDK